MPLMKRISKKDRWRERKRDIEVEKRKRKRKNIDWVAIEKRRESGR